MRYLYGASVQGIQNFIFETNKLKEIAGGSEFVDDICTSRFQRILGKEPHNQIQGAAGIVRYLFHEDELDALNRMVKYFPFEIQKEAPGITISQAVVKVDGELTSDHMSDLIRKLDTQRNNLQHSFLAAPMIAERSRTTGQAAVKKVYGEYLSQQQNLKRHLTEISDNLANKIGLDRDSLPMNDLDELSGKGDNKDKWLAIIHADANSLGKLILKANSALEKSGDVKAFYKKFSKALDKATIEAASTATQQVLKVEIENWNERHSDDQKVPIRPVLLGGDDLTVIIKAKYAFEFTERFIEAFEFKSKVLVYEQVLKEYGDFPEFSNGLTTCAGIAYVKPNYPFHYAESLAQKLCKAAKKVSKGINNACAPSSVMFHQVHSSFVDDEWQETVERELTVKEIGSFLGGPYFLNVQTGYKSIKDIKDWATAMDEKEEDGKRTSLKAQVRSLITTYIDNPNGAGQYEARLRQLNPKKLEALGFHGRSIFYDNKEGVKVSHAWDIIKLATIQQDNT